MAAFGPQLQAELRLFAKALGARIRELRTAKGISQRRLAFYVGVSMRFIDYIERGQKSLSLDSARRLCMVFRITLGDLIRDLQIKKVVRKKPGRQVVPWKHGTSRVQRIGKDRSAHYRRLQKEREARGEPPRPRGWNLVGEARAVTTAGKKDPSIPPVVNKNRDRKRRLRAKKMKNARKNKETQKS